VGNVLREIKSLGLYDKSIIVLTSDHGEEFMDRGPWIGHDRTLHQEMIKVPLIIKLPGHKSGVVECATGLIDIVPTIYHYLGIRIPKNIEGSPIDFRCGNNPNPIFSEVFRPVSIHKRAGRAVIFNNRKLILDQLTRHKKIFDLNEDPFEKKDLSAQYISENKILEDLMMQYITDVQLKEGALKKPKPASQLTDEQLNKLQSLGYL